MTEYAIGLENGTDTAPRVRAAHALPLTPGTTPLSARGGLRRDGGGAVTVVAGTMQVEVSPFLGWVNGEGSATQGGYPFVLDATKPLTLSDGDPLQVRTDTVVAEVRDDTHDASGETVARVWAVQGTPGGGAPTVPDGCFPLRDVNVPAGLSAGTGGLAGSNLGADRRTYTAALGGVVTVANATERDAMDAVTGTMVYRQDTDELQVRRYASWQTVLTGTNNTYTSPLGGQSMTHGVESITTNGSGLATIAHGLGQTPGTVVFMPYRGGMSASFVKSRDASTFTIEVRNSDNQPQPSFSGTLGWIAAV